MNLFSTRSGLLSHSTPWRAKSVVPVVFAFLGALALSILLVLGEGRLAVAGSLLALLGGMAVVQPRLSIVLTFVYLAVLGDARRLLVALFGWSGQDPLILVGPVVTIALFVAALSRKQIKLTSRLSFAIAVLSGIMVLQMVNPNQGGLDVGFIGALFYLIPLLWFWIGRAYATERFVRQVLVGCVLPLSVLAAAVGLYQTYVGLLPHQAAWVDLGGYSALYVNDFVRAFGFFPSSEEYVYYLGVGAIIATALVLRRSLGLLPVALLLLGTAFLGGTRTIIVLFLFASMVMWAIQATRRATWVPRIALALLLGVGGLTWALQQSASLTGTGQAQSMIARQSELLDPSKTTASGHLNLIANGIYRGFATPAGMGLGATTHAAARHGSHIGGSEKDFSDMFIALGFLGGLTYLVVMAFTVWGVTEYWHHARTTLALIVVGVVLVMLGQWLKGGLYAINPLIWFVIGATDRLRVDHLRTQEEPTE